jgi:ribonuclease R
MATRMMDLIPSLERVFKQFMESPGYRPMTRSEIAAALSLGPDRRRELRLLLRRMREAGDIVLLRKNRWARPDSANTVTGRLSVHTRGHGTLDDPRCPGLLIRVEADAMRNAIHGDLVEVDPLPARRFGHRRRRHPAATDAPEAAGRIVRVIERGHPVLSGLLKKTQYYWYLIPANPRFPNTVRVRDAAPGVVRVDGHMAAVRLDPWSPFDPLLSGCLIEVMGRPDDPGVDMIALMRQYGLMDQHPREAMEEAGAIAPAIHESTLKGRTDLRDALSITIDPIDAKDFDDAVSLVRRTDGAWVLDVHIADVAHHVRPGSAIDKEAGARGTSVYLVDRTVPMLPHDLTTDVCSLRPDCDRLCHTVRLVLDSSGRTLEESTFRSVIRSRYRMDYDAVQAMIDDPSGAKAHGEIIPNWIRTAAFDPLCAGAPWRPTV